MESTANDVTGFVASCVQRILDVGFDASAFETAKWAGVACLVALALSAASGFAARLWKGAADIAPPVSENQFRWLLYVGALLIALPVATKVTTDTTALEFASSERSYAQEICRDQLQSVAQTAEIGALEARLESLGLQIAALRSTRPSPTSSIGQPAEQPSVASETDPAILGKAVSIFYRSARAEDAEVIADILGRAGAGVARRASDLSETAAAQSARRGDIYLLSDTRAGDGAQAVESTLAENGFDVSETITLGALSGTAIQILLY